MKIKFYTFFITISGFLALFAAGDDRLLLNRTIEKYTSLTKEFHTKTISAFALKRELAENADIVLIDVREKKEQDISRLPKAISKDEFLKNLDSYKGKKIVVYCTIGFRSGKFAAEHKDLNILNLEGGVLAWSHFNGKFFNGEKETRKVHTYSKEWNFLNSKYEAVYE